jgi:uncharacterized caspase-like protein
MKLARTVFPVAVLLGAISASAFPETPSPGKRIALLIANSDYPNDNDVLTRPQIDAAKIKNALAAHGFTGIGGDRRPTVKSNVTAAELQGLVAALSADIKRAGPGAIGFFYYAGHGVADDRESYVVPIDTPDLARVDADHRVPVYAITDMLSQALQPARPTIVVVVDACRTRARNRSRGPAGAAARKPGTGPQLQPMKPGLLLAMSAGIGEAASDSGEYADALERALNSSGLTIPGVFDQVKEEVWQKSQNAQLPVHISSLVSTTCLVSCTAKEVLTDPKEILAKRGILWSTETFYDAVRSGDLETSKLFLAGHMSTAVPDHQGRTLPIVVALNQSNPDKVVDLLARSGVDLNARYDVWAPQGNHKKTLLERAIERGNLAVVKALLAHKVRLNDPMETFGQMGLTIRMPPLAAAIYWEHLDIAAEMLNAGADPWSGNYEAYKRAQDAVRKKPALAAQVDALMPRIAPPGAERARLDAQPQVAVDQCIRKIVATPREQMLDEASRFDVFSHLTLGPRECVLAKINVSLVVNDRACYRPDFIPTQARMCCEQSFGLRRTK